LEKLDERLEWLEARISEVEARFRTLREENARLKAMLEASGEGAPMTDSLMAGSSSGAGPTSEGTRDRERPERRSFRLAVLEAERQEVRTRLRSLIEAL
jgi:chaperonin cofactor prefoldin